MVEPEVQPLQQDKVRITGQNMLQERWIKNTSDLTWKLRGKKDKERMKINAVITREVKQEQGFPLLRKCMTPVQTLTQKDERDAQEQDERFQWDACFSVAVHWKLD